MLIDDMVPALLADAPSCPVVMAQRAIVLAAAELCRDTLVWNALQDPITLVDGTADYDVEAPSGAQVVAVMGAWVNGVAVVPKTMDALTAESPGWMAHSGSTPRWFHSAKGAALISLVPTPQDAQRAKLVLRAAFAPLATATELPDDLANEHHELILDGARARLLLQLGRAWSDPRLGEYSAMRFAEGKVAVRIDVLHDGAPGSLSVQRRPFGF